ncbi:MAG: hypothetical protein Q7S16_03610 [bacterium]|nr:hypothetical protein [bacterium]
MGIPLTFRFFFVLFAETIGDFLLFPVWWYTGGLFRTVKGVGSAIARRQRSLALGLWIANLFKPMYGQEDLQGKIISFFFRLLILFWRVILFFLWLVCMAVILLFYVILPVVIVYGIIGNIHG